MVRTCARKLIFWTILCHLSPDMDGIWSLSASISPPYLWFAIWDFAQTPYWDRRIWSWIWRYESIEKPMKTIRDTRVRTFSCLLASLTDILLFPLKVWSTGTSLSWSALKKMYPSTRSTANLRTSIIVAWGLVRQTAADRCTYIPGNLGVKEGEALHTDGKDFVWPHQT